MNTNSQNELINLLSEAIKRKLSSNSCNKQIISDEKLEDSDIRIILAMNRKTVVNMFNKLHNMLQDKSWLNKPEQRRILEL